MNRVAGLYNKANHSRDRKPVAQGMTMERPGGIMTQMEAMGNHMTTQPLVTLPYFQVGSVMKQLMGMEVLEPKIDPRELANIPMGRNAGFHNMDLTCKFKHQDVGSSSRSGDSADSRGRSPDRYGPKRAATETLELDQCGWQ